MPERSMPVDEAISGAIRAIRRERRCSQRVLAERWGECDPEPMSISTRRKRLSDIEVGRYERPLRLQQLLTLALALDVSPPSLFEAYGPAWLLLGNRSVERSALMDWLVGEHPLDGQERRFFDARRPVRLLVTGLPDWRGRGASIGESGNTMRLSLNLLFDTFVKAITEGDTRAIESAAEGLTAAVRSATRVAIRDREQRGRGLPYQSSDSPQTVLRRTGGDR